MKTMHRMNQPGASAMGVLDFGLSLPTRETYQHVGLSFTTSPDHTLWITLKRQRASPAHSFTLPLLRELLELAQTLRAGSAHWMHQGGIRPVHYAVLRSAHPDYFSLGGDLARFRDCIRRHDRNALLAYARLCLQLMREWMPASHPGVCTIALVQGRALGGGFEAALAADYLVAEEHSSFGFPEILFGLFPCTGALQLLARRIPLRQAERLMTSGKVYSAAAMLEMGVIDAICPTGAGVAAVEHYIASHARQRGARMLVHEAAERMCPPDFEEMTRIAQEWVELALALPEESLHVMDLLIDLQAGPGRACRRGNEAMGLQR
jgi:DSF synthase